MFALIKSYRVYSLGDGSHWISVFTIYPNGDKGSGYTRLNVWIITATASSHNKYVLSFQTIATIFFLSVYLLKIFDQFQNSSVTKVFFNGQVIEQLAYSIA